MTNRLNSIKVNKAKHPFSELYICCDCVFIFHIHTKMTNGRNKPFCPNCGDLIAVKKYNDMDIPKRQWEPWTNEELVLIERIIKGELKKYQVEKITGRTYGAIQRKVERMKKIKNP